MHIEATLDDDKPAALNNITINVRAGNDAKVRRTDQTDQDFDTVTTVQTDSAGKVAFVLLPGTQADQVVLDLTPEHPDPDAKYMLDWRPAAKITVVPKTPPLSARNVYPDALSLEAKQQNGKQPATYQKVRVRVIGDPDALLFSDPDEAWDVRRRGH